MDVESEVRRESLDIRPRDRELVPRELSYLLRAEEDRQN